MVNYEAEILEFLESIGIDNVVTNDKQLIGPLELGFFLPGYNIAIEFDRIYQHGEQQGKFKKYHLNKTDACLEKGVQLIHIFETEWVGKKEVIKSVLKAKLGKLPTLCYARKCDVKEITVKESGPFLNKHHRQGSAPSSLKFGAYYNDELVAVMTFAKPSVAKGRKDNSSLTNFELSRFASKMNSHIPGIASKLFKFFTKNYTWDAILTFADRRYSLKNFYEKIGFSLTNVTAPCYWYFHKEKTGTHLTHRFRFRKSELPKLLDIFDSNDTEYENMLKNGYDRLWDCGNYRFILENKK